MRYPVKEGWGGGWRVQEKQAAGREEGSEGGLA